MCHDSSIPCFFTLASDSALNAIECFESAVMDSSHEEAVNTWSTVVLMVWLFILSVLNSFSNSLTHSVNWETAFSISQIWALSHRNNIETTSLNCQWTFGIIIGL